MYSLGIPGVKLIMKLNKTRQYYDDVLHTTTVYKVNI